MVQRRAARYVCNNYNREASVTAMIKHLHWRSLQQRRTDIRLVMFYKTLHDIYINHLPNNLKSTVLLFADDTIIYMTISNGTDATALQQDLDKLAKWEETWQMEFHPQKCSVLHITRSRNPKYKQYTLHGHILVKEDNVKYLGVVINKTLSWNNHINDVTKKPNASLGFLQRNLRIGLKK